MYYIKKSKNQQETDIEDDVIVRFHSGGVLEVRLNRPDKLNSVTSAMVTTLGVAVSEVARDSANRCLLLTASGRGFCAGRDLSDAVPGEDAEAILGNLNRVVASLYECPIPTVVAVNGAAMGFGLGLALACDVVFAGQAAKFAIPFARLGAALDSGGHYLLRRRLTEGKILQMIYSAEPVGGGAAAAMGLADVCCTDADLQGSAMAFAMACAAGPSLAFQKQKALLRAADAMSLGEVLAAEAKLQGELAKTADYREGVSAFLAKRKPNFLAA